MAFPGGKKEAPGRLWHAINKCFDSPSRTPWWVAIVVCEERGLLFAEIGVRHQNYATMPSGAGCKILAGLDGGNVGLGDWHLNCMVLVGWALDRACRFVSETANVKNGSSA